MNMELSDDAILSCFIIIIILTVCTLCAMIIGICETRALKKRAIHHYNHPYFPYNECRDHGYNNRDDERVYAENYTLRPARPIDIARAKHDIKRKIITPFTPQQLTSESDKKDTILGAKNEKNIQLSKSEIVGLELVDMYEDALTKAPKK